MYPMFPKQETWGTRVSSPFVGCKRNRAEDAGAWVPIHKQRRIPQEDKEN